MGLMKDYKGLGEESIKVRTENENLTPAVDVALYVNSNNGTYILVSSSSVEQIAISLDSR